MSDDALEAPPVDRRTSMRQAASVPVAILSDAWAAFAVVVDVSDAGALLLTREDVEVETRVRLHVLLGSHVRPPAQAVGEVLRSERRDGEGLYWSHQVAIQFLDRQGPWEEALTDVAERQAELRRTDP